jgi:uncharacterized protein (TIGR02466 family)
LDNQFNVATLFPLSIYTGEMKITNEEQEHLEQLEYSMMPNGGHISVDRNILERTEFSKLNEQVQEHLDNFVVNILRYKIDMRITTSWGVKFTPGSHGHEHYHMNSLISGVFYTKTVESGGRIAFKSEHQHTVFPRAVTPEKIETNHLNQDNIIFQPQPNSILLFPSWLLHKVEQNTSTQDRYSVAFNTFGSGIIGEDECRLDLK